MAKFLRENKENLIYLVFWILLFLAPVLILRIRSSDDDGIAFQWHEVFVIWKLFAVYLLIFLIHNFILAPMLIYRHRKAVYAAVTTALITLFIIFQCMNRPESGMHPDRQSGKNAGSAYPKKEPHWGMPDERMPTLLVGQTDILNSITIIFLLGMNIGVKMYFKSEEDHEELLQLEKQNLEHQLEYLKYQINPHFFMNTLNNIHALIDIDAEKAKSSILELSKMMRYVLYEGNRPFIPLKTEIEFLNHYITLMRMRYTDAVKINMDIPARLHDGKIPPLLLITFVENAFKHGISYQSDSCIHIIVRTDGGRLHFKCLNRKHTESTEEHGGVGLANVRQRLELIYGTDYSLSIEDGTENYGVTLGLPLVKE